MKRSGTLKKTLALLVLCIATTSCTNSEWFLSFLYNRLDNNMYSEMSGYADFSRDQKTQIRDLIDRFHHWHRVTQLPLYSDFLREISEEITTTNQISYEQITNWSQQIERFVIYSSHCNPMNVASSIMVSLTDEQVEEIYAYQLETHDEAVEQLTKDSDEEHFEDVSKGVAKNLRRIDLSISDTQEEALITTIKNLPDLRQVGLELSWQWNQELYELLKTRNQSEFAVNVQRHLLSLETLVEDNHPTEVSKIRRLWNEFFVGIINENIADSQDFPRFLQRLSKNLDSISQKISRDQQELNPKDYCNIEI